MDLFELVGKIKIDNKNANKEMDSTTGKANSTAGKFTSAMKKIASAVAVGFAVKKVVDFGKECISMGSDVQEMENKFNVVFNGMTDEVDKWAGDFASAIGRNKNTIKGYLADNQNMFVGMGMTREAGADLSEQMVSLALDLASFNNLQEDDAVNAMSKAIMGESESAKSLGAVLNDNTRAMAMNELGYKGKYQSLTEAQKMEVNYQAILMQSTDAVGDCERSLDSYKGKQIQLNSAIENVKETIGMKLLPMMTALLSATVTLVTNASAVLMPFIDTCVGWANQIADVVAPIVQTAFSTIQGYINGSIEDSTGTITFFQETFSTVMEIIQTIWMDVGPPLFDAIVEYVGIAIDFFVQNWPTIQLYFTTCLDIIKTAWNTIGKPVFDLIMDVVGKVMGIFKQYMPAISKLFKDVVSTIKKQWDANLKPVFEAIGNFITNTLKPTFDKIFTYGIKPIVEACFTTIEKLWNNSLKPIFEGICEFLNGVFTLNWSKAFDGLAKVAKGAFSGLAEAVKAPFRAIANLWNSTVGSLSFTIPDWVPGMGGKGWSVPKIPTFAKGTEWFAGGLALVGEKGPELVDLPRGSRVTANDKLNNMLGDASGNANAEINALIKKIIALLELLLDTDKILQLNKREFGRIVREVTGNA